MKASFFIKDIFNIPSIGPILAGVVKSGELSVGMQARVAGKTLLVKALEQKNSKIDLAVAEDSVGVILEEADYDLLKPYIKQEIVFDNE
jgi:selenocysteine-specific translation elongation factor